MKKFISMFLAIIMVLSLAVTVVAADGDGAFKIGDNSYDNLADALAAAENGDTIVMTKDHTEESVAQNKFAITKSITLDGGGYTLSFTSAANVFPFKLNTDGVEFTVKNFANINFQGGGFDVSKGILNLSDLNANSKGRATIKTTGTGTINVENATLYTPSTASQSEAVCILAGTTAVLNLNNGAVLRKDQGANGSTTTQATVLYTTGNGNITINMKSGSKIVSNHGAGQAKAAIIGRDGSGATITLNMEQGAYLVADSANLSEVTFLYNTASFNFNLNAPDGSFLVKNGLTVALPGFQSGPNDGAKTYEFVALETSPVEGYTAYKAQYDISNAVFKYVTDADGEGYATSFASALMAAKTGTVVTLLKDFDSNETGITFAGKTLTVDLDGKKLNFTNNSNYVMSSIKGDLTFKDGTIDLYRGFIVQAGGHITFDNVTATSQYAVNADGGALSRPVVKLNGAGYTQLTLVDSTLVTYGKGEALVLVESSTEGVITLEGNSVLNYAGTLTGVNQNMAAIAVQNATSLIVNVGEGSKIMTSGQTSDNAEKITSIIADQTTGDITLNLAKGSIMEINRTPGASGSEFVHTRPDYEGGKFTINDRGCSFVISAEVAQAGIELPAALLGYKVNGVALEPDAETGVYYFADAEATEAVTINAMVIDIEMLLGASIRNALPFGLRFTATISEDVYNALLAIDPNVKVGFALAKARKAGSSFNIENILATDYVIADGKNITVADGVVSFNTTVFVEENSCLISSANASGFKTSISAKAFITLTIDGVETTYWVNFDSTDNSRSMYDVAKGYYEDTVNGSTDNQVVNYILDTCGYKFK